MKGRKPTPSPTGQELPPPAPPAELKGEARKEWKRITAILAKQRVLTEADQVALIIYCTSWQQYQDATAQINAKGRVIQGDRGTVRNPYVTVQNAAWDRIRPLLSEFGLTPTARARLKVDESGDDGGDFF